MRKRYHQQSRNRRAYRCAWVMVATLVILYSY